MTAQATEPAKPGMTAATTAAQSLRQPDPYLERTTPAMTMTSLDAPGVTPGSGMASLPAAASASIVPRPRAAASSAGAGLRRVAADGYALIDAGGWLDLGRLAGLYADVPADPYVPEGFRYKSLARVRMHGTEPAAGSHEPLYQSLEFNPVHGGIQRHYPPLSAGFVAALADPLRLFQAMARLGEEDEVPGSGAAGDHRHRGGRSSGGRGVPSRRRGVRRHPAGVPSGPGRRQDPARCRRGRPRPGLRRRAAARPAAGPRRPASLALHLAGPRRRGTRPRSPRCDPFRLAKLPSPGNCGLVPGQVSVSAAAATVPMAARRRSARCAQVTVRESIDSQDHGAGGSSGAPVTAR